MESQKIYESKKSLETITVLVVDDDVTCLTVVAAILRTFRYEVVTVKHPTDALSTLRASGGAFDLVVSDVHMPDMNGFELQQAILKEFNIPVVLMSADEKESVVANAIEMGASSFIMKPVSRNALKNLWQLVASANKKSRVVIQETGDGKSNNSEEGGGSELAMAAAKRDAKQKSPRKEVIDDKSVGILKKSSQKKPKVVWNNTLHNKFLEAIRNIGLDRAVPKRILQEMKVPGLTRENVASHLQKYRIFLRRVSDATCKMQYALDQGSPIRPVLTSGFGQSRLVTNKGSLLTNSRVHTRNPSLQVDPVLSRTVPNAPLHIHHQPNYMAYNMLNLQQQHATTSELLGDQIDNQLNDIHVASPRSQFLDIDQILKDIGTFASSSSSNHTDKNTRAGKFPGIVEEFQMPFSPNTNHLLTVGEEIDLASSFSPLTGLSDFDIMSFQHCPEDGDVNPLGYTVNAPNEAQQNDGLTPELLSATTHRETNFTPASHQDTSQGHGNLSTLAEYGIASHLPSNVLVPPTEYEDDDFLQSLLTAPSMYDEDHITLDGIY